MRRLLARADDAAVESGHTSDGSEVRILLDPSGARLAVALDPTGQPREPTPAFRPGRPTLADAVMGEHLDVPGRTKDLMRVELMQWVEAAVEFEQLGAAHVGSGDTHRIEVAGLARRWTWHVDEATYLSHYRGVGGTSFPRFDPWGLSPPAECEPGCGCSGSTPPPMSASASVTGRVVTARILRNALGGEQFIHAVVTTPWLDLDVAMSASLGTQDLGRGRRIRQADVPPPGAILFASVALVARPAADVPESA